MLKGIFGLHSETNHLSPTTAEWQKSEKSN